MNLISPLCWFSFLSCDLYLFYEIPSQGCLHWQEAMGEQEQGSQCGHLDFSLSKLNKPLFFTGSSGSGTALCDGKQTNNSTKPPTKPRLRTAAQSIVSRCRAVHVRQEAWVLLFPQDQKAAVFIFYLIASTVISPFVGFLLFVCMYGTFFLD